MNYCRQASLGDFQRLEALNCLKLLDAPIEPELQKMMSLLARLIDAQVTLVSLVDKTRQYFSAAVGLPQAWADCQQAPLSHSFCQHVVTSGEALMITDSERDERVKGNLGIDELGIAAYLGYPLIVGGETLGSVCAIRGRPHQWTAREQELVAHFADAVSSKLDARYERQKFLQHLEERGKLDESFRVAIDVYSRALAIPLGELRTVLEGDSLGHLTSIQNLLEQVKEEATVVCGPPQDVMVLDLDED